MLSQEGDPIVGPLGMGGTRLVSLEHAPPSLDGVSAHLAGETTLSLQPPSRCQPRSLESRRVGSIRGLVIRSAGRGPARLARRCPRAVAFLRGTSPGSESDARADCCRADPRRTMASTKHQPARPRPHHRPRPPGGRRPPDSGRCSSRPLDRAHRIELDDPGLRLGYHLSGRCPASGFRLALQSALGPPSRCARCGGELRAKRTR